MPDNQLEDRIRATLRGEGEVLPLTITAQELERRLALRRRARAGRRLRVLAAGIAAIAIGGIVVAGNGWLGSGPSVGGRPSSTTGVIASPSASREPAAPDASSASPVASSDGQLPCDPLDPTQEPGPPLLVAAAMPGDALGHGGTVVASEWAGRASGNAGTWDGLPADPDPVVIGPTSKVFEVVSDGCLTQVSAEALLTVYAEAPRPSPTPLPLRLVRGGTRSRVVDLAPPGVGGWTVRVRASFVTTDGSLAWSESLFRVMVPFDAPKLTLQQGSGQPVSADGNCVSFTLVTGASASDQCGGAYQRISGVDPLVMARGASVNLSLANDWRIDQARVTAVQADLVAAGDHAPEYSVGFLDKGGSTLTTPIVLDPGSWIVRVSLNGSRNGDTFGAWYDLPVTITP